MDKKQQEELQTFLESPKGEFVLECIKQISNFNNVHKLCANPQMQAYTAGQASVYVALQEIKNQKIKEKENVREY